MTDHLPHEHHEQLIELPLRPGMRVVDTTVNLPVGLPGVVVAVTERWCVVRLNHGHALRVSPWSRVGLLGIRPTAEILSPNAEERDHRNKIADVLRVLLEIEEPDEKMRGLIEGMEHELASSSPA